MAEAGTGERRRRLTASRRRVQLPLSLNSPVADWVGPSISWAAFDLGRVQARIKSARAQTDAALAAYEGAVLNALGDTEGALITYGRSQTRREALRVAAAASDKAADLAQKRFEGGLIDFLEVLDAERTALSAELLLSQSRTDAATSLIAVYKALGAGWTVSEASTAANTQP